MGSKPREQAGALMIADVWRAPLLGLIVGAFLGGLLSANIAVGGALGAIVGVLIAGRQNGAASRADVATEARLANLENEVHVLRVQVDALQSAKSAPADVAAPAPREMQPTRHWSESLAIPAPEPQPDPDKDTFASYPMEDADAAPGIVAVSGPGSSLDAFFERARSWLFGGNTVVRVGLVVLFFGFAFLARYAVEHSLLPVQFRLAAIALGGVALLVTGWRLRSKRTGFAMSMQGGGVAVLYLTAFAAMRLYGLLPPTLAFALLLVLVVLAAVLAVLQDAPALAEIGTAGGFMAPILASTGSGDHVALFAYYSVLNLCVVGIAWKKAWRVLNLTGFLFTFSIALFWGARDYRPELLASTEPFLIGFFLMYVAAAVLYAWRQTPQLKHYVDGGLVFGTPVVGFGLQAALCQHIEYAMAWSALAVGGFYVLLARWLLSRSRDSLRLLVESFAVLGIVFLTLAIPLALDGRWTAAAWAMEGAALLWVGARQSRKLAIASGLLLQLGAGVFFIDGGGLDDYRRGLPLANAQLVGALLIAVAGFFASRLAGLHRANWERVLVPASTVLLVWATLWWLAGGISEMDAWLTRHEMPAASLLFFALSAVAAGWIARRLAWPALYAVVLIGVAGMAMSLVYSADAGKSPAAGWGLAAWAVATLTHLWSLRQAEAADFLQRWLARAHTAGLWLLTAALAWMLHEAVEARLSADSWTATALLLAPLAMVHLVLALDRRDAWPLDRWAQAYLGPASAGLVAVLVGWALIMNVAGDGRATPLPYLLLLNPLELGLCAALVTSLRWWQYATKQQSDSSRFATRDFPRIIAALAFLVANGMLLRALHHYTGVRWDCDALFASDTVQMAVSLFWAALGLVLTFLASRKARRTLWIVGATLLGAVVAKLFLIDMDNTGTVARIISFIGAGVLLLVVGYFSPLPPAREASA